MGWDERQKIPQDTLCSRGRRIWGSWGTKFKYRTHCVGTRKSEIYGLARKRTKASI